MAATIALTYWLAMAAGCVGKRQVAMPSSAAGYQRVELRDIVAMGLKDVNVEIEARVGPLDVQDSCSGVLMMSLFNPTGASFAAVGSGSSAVIATYGQVTISIPRKRYGEVRDLKPYEHVVVRGYLSKWWANGCDWHAEDDSSARYLWVDSIARDTPPTPVVAPVAPAVPAPVAPVTVPPIAK